MNYELTFTTAAVPGKPLAAWSIPDAPPASPARPPVHNEQARTVGSHAEPWDRPDHRESSG
jgi:hypothetical protein